MVYGSCWHGSKSQPPATVIHTRKSLENFQTADSPAGGHSESRTGVKPQSAGLEAGPPGGCRDCFEWAMRRTAFMKRSVFPLVVIIFVAALSMWSCSKSEANGMDPDTIASKYG